MNINSIQKDLEIAVQHFPAIGEIILYLLAYALVALVAVAGLVLGLDWALSQLHRAMRRVR